MSTPPAPATRLQLFLAPGDVIDPEGFRVFARRPVDLGEYRVRMHVIGESSLVLVERRGVALAEVITCGPDGVPGQAPVGLMFEIREGALAAAATRQANLEYAVRVRVSALSAAEAGGSLPEVLEHRFPGPGAPLTRIEAGAVEGALRLRTRHDYPEHGASVWSESEWRPIS